MNKFKCFVVRLRDMKKFILVFVIVFVLLVLFGVMIVQVLVKEVSIIIDGKIFYYKIIKFIVREVLEEN